MNKDRAWVRKSVCWLSARFRVQKMSSRKNIWKAKLITGNRESSEDCSNYWPISLLSTIAKAFETICPESNIHLSECQAGFRKKSSTQTSLLNIINKSYMNMDKGRLSGIIFLDLKKIFGCVDHKILLRKTSIFWYTRNHVKPVSIIFNK